MVRSSDTGTGSSVSAGGGVRRRPKDRRQQIIAAAATQFADVGFHNVSMASIADAVGIGASALYRHFEDKQSLLRAAVTSAFERFHEATSGVEDTEALLERMITTTIEHRELGTLWQREVRHLDADDQATCRRWLRDGHARLVAVLAADRGLPGDDLDLRAWAIQSVHTTLSRQHDRFAAASLVELLRMATDSIRGADLVVPEGAPVRPPVPVVRPPSSELAPASRRELLLAVAIELIGAHGYRAVSLQEIAATAGIAAPSVYNHFPSKDAILVTAFRRATEALMLSLHTVFRVATSPKDALDRLLVAYTRMALDHTALFSLLVTEAIHLPHEHRDELRRMQLDHVAEWVALLSTSRPDLGDDRARALVQATLGLVIDLARTPSLRERTWLADELVALGRAVLDTPFTGTAR